MALTLNLTGNESAGNQNTAIPTLPQPVPAEYTTGKYLYQFAKISAELRPELCRYLLTWNQCCWF